MSIPDPAAAVDWYFLAVGAVGILAFVYKVARRVERMGEALDKITAKEFGGNSGGLRQAVNEIGDKVDLVHGRITTVQTDVAHVRGRFEQHIEEHRR